MVLNGCQIPVLNQLETLYANKNKISNLSVFVERLYVATPNLKYLSLLGNEACPKYVLVLMIGADMLSVL